jgi:hypothetical protein
MLNCQSLPADEQAEFSKHDISRDLLAHVGCGGRWRISPRLSNGEGAPAAGDFDEFNVDR